MCFFPSALQTLLSIDYSVLVIDRRTKSVLEPFVSRSKFWRKNRWNKLISQGMLNWTDISFQEWPQGRGNMQGTRWQKGLRKPEGQDWASICILNKEVWFCSYEQTSPQGSESCHSSRDRLESDPEKSVRMAKLFQQRGQAAFPFMCSPQS